jgi:hypothetical protein
MKRRSSLQEFREDGAAALVAETLLPRFAEWRKNNPLPQEYDPFDIFRAGTSIYSMVADAEKMLGDVIRAKQKGENLPDAWRDVGAAQILLLHLEHGIEPTGEGEELGRKLAALRHKDNRADRDFIRQWYRENRATYEKELGGKGGKDAAATDAKEQHLVDQGWRTIRGYLNKI